MTTAIDLNVPFSTAEFKRVKAVRFSMFDADTLTGYSVAEVNTEEVYVNGLPIHGGVNDPRLGPIDIRSFCESCGGGLKECPGHWGHLTLARPMFHWGFMRATHNVLRCVCYYCSRLLADPKDHKMHGAMGLRDPKKRLMAVMLCCRSKKRCQVAVDAEEEEEEHLLEPGKEDGGEGRKFAGGCGYLQPRYFIENTVMHIAFPEGGEEESAGQDRRRVMNAEEALTIFRRISIKDIKRMGFDPKFNHPQQLILTHLPIPPMHVRPTISFGANRSEDDVTAKLLDIVKTNFMLKTQVESGAGDHICMEFAKLLQYHIYTLSDNCIIGIPQATTKSKRPLKSIRERLKSKEGRLRGHLMGKRVDFCARSVIGGDPNLNTEQVGVPRSVALNLTFPERVTPHNMDHMKRLVENGPTTWPGARYIVREDGSRIDLRYVSDTSVLELQYGWKVERHMEDGDYIIFNRQPSLHKMSMMGHRVKVMPFSTLRFNLSVTPPYNADFDGDEMNLHLGQTHETRAEIKHLMLNPRMVVSSQGNKPVMSIVQDSLLAVSKFTKRDTYVEKDLAMNLLMWLPVWDGQLPIPALLRPKELWTGKQLLSFLIPKGLTMTRDCAIASKNKKDEMDFAASDCRVLIQDGELLSGIICKKTVGSSSGSLLHLVWLDYGPENCRNLISFLQKLVNQWMVHNGFSCGVADIIANDETLFNVEKTLVGAKAEVRAILAKAQRGDLEAQPGKTMYQSFEAKVNQRLNAAREDAGRIGSDSLDERNNIISMVNAGSKGSPINIAQIIACVGQQNVEGSRIRFGFENRTLPHFTKDDFGAESRGFVENSYLAGLTPQEVWMHAMGGREGVIDTACKTSETGYIQRRLVKSMETLRVHYDGTSRNGCSDIIQFLYGEDGMDGLWIEDQTLDIMTMDNQKFEDAVHHQFEKEDYGIGWLDGRFISELREDADSQGQLNTEWDQLKNLKETICTQVFIDGDSKQHMPINVRRLIGRAKNLRREQDLGIDKKYYTPVEIVKKVNELMSKLEVTRAIADGDVIGREVEDNAKIVLQAHLRCALSSKRILQSDKLSCQSFDWLLGEIKQRFMRSCVFAGEMIGTLAAQSVGEPATQMTLNTFHFAGVGAKNVTLGVPRLKELINVAKTVKTPSLAVFLFPDVGKDQERAKDVQATLEHTTLKSVTSFTQIFWDPDPVQTRILEDRDWVEEYYELPDEDEDPGRCGAWLLRIQLSNKVMTDKKLTVREVGERIVKDFAGDLDCIFTDDNAEELVLRIRLLKEKAEMDDNEPRPFDASDDKEDKDFKFLRSIEANILKEMTLKGIHGIKKVFMREDTISRYTEEKGKFERSKEWVLDTDGVNLEEVMQLDNIDFARLQSNDVVETLQVLGIEAVRKALLFHVRMVIQFDGSYVNYRHLGTMCDVMTQRGHLMAITRHGVNRTNLGPLMKCSFEETVEILMDAAIYNETDRCRAVSENVIMGNLAPIGTGVFDLYMDDKKTTELDGKEGLCMLDSATPVLPSQKIEDGFGLASPSGSPTLGQTPMPGETPYEDRVEADGFGQTPGDTLADLPTPEVSPVDDDDVRPGDVERTPFSPGVEVHGGTSPFSPVQGSPAASDTSGYSPVQSPALASPADAAPHSPSSPTYSPALNDEFRRTSTSPMYNPISPTYTPQSHYTTSASGHHSGTQGSTTSPAFTSTATAKRRAPGLGERDYSSTSPLYSPTYSPSGAYSYTPARQLPTSPMYTPQSPAYTPTSPAYRAPSEGTSRTVSAREGGGPGSPVVQEHPPDSPNLGVATSPTYTPHQMRASGDMTSEPAFSRSPASSSLFEPSYEPSDDEMPSLTYSPPTGPTGRKTNRREQALLRGSDRQARPGPYTGAVAAAAPVGGGQRMALTRRGAPQPPPPPGTRPRRQDSGDYSPTSVIGGGPGGGPSHSPDSADYR